MIARIEMIPGDDEYVVFKEEDCRDEADLSAYRTAKQMGESIVQGKINVTPLKREDLIEEIADRDMENAGSELIEWWARQYVLSFLIDVSDQELQAEYEERFK